MNASLYEDVGGFDVLLAVCRRWNALCLADPVAAHPFAHGTLHPQHDERLAAYLAEALGGPRLYTGGYGDETTVQRVHAGNGAHPDLDEACVRLFRQALDDVGVPPAAGERVGDHFERQTVAMRVYGGSRDDVPSGLALPSA
ncbi:globin domain-containing protein [Krasilnikoviella flava]|uniref:Hemoglobin n=1 Tax=Krasilnikoviella flava TaxID=526729 RepID=A0A1T5JLC0_9MICO|nr:oxidoreductase [Krasilnikoviella flava]SKC52209.1 hemoglobin [Krasilnikoviella flava]